MDTDDLALPGGTMTQGHHDPASQDHPWNPPLLMMNMEQIGSNLRLISQFSLIQLIDVPIPVDYDYEPPKDIFLGQANFVLVQDLQK